MTYSNLSMKLVPSGPSGLGSVDLYFGNASSTTKVFSAQGPFEPGVSRVLDVTLPLSVVVTPGVTYLATIEGYAQGSLVASASTQVAAE